MALNDTTVSSVSKLHDDILCHIFRFNSYPTHLTQEGDLWGIFSTDACLERHKSGPPLVTNRRTSQVCRQWRKVMIHSASIWANAIDLHYLQQSQDDWRKEVLIRTGEAPLTVFGCIRDPVGALGSVTQDVSALSFVLEILEDHWERVQTLIIFSRSEALDEKLYNLLSRPAPNLMQFVVAVKEDRVSNNIIPFMNQAPNLRIFRTDGLLPDFSEPSWSSKLRYLDLSCPKEGIFIPELLHSLKSMTCLEVLRLVRPTHEFNTNDVQRINARGPMIKLRSLRSFAIQNSDSVVSDLLSRILIPSECTFHVDYTYDCGVENGLVYTTFFRNNFVRPTVTHLTYSLQYTDPDYLRDDEPDDDEYMLDISFGSGSSESRFKYSANLEGVNGTAFHMAEDLLACDLSNVTTLSLCLNVHRPERFHEYPLFQSMYNFLLSFKSVRTLHTDEDTLKLYMGSERLSVNNLLFPCLDTVYTNHWDTGIKEFLAYRHNNADRTDGSGVSRIKRLFFTKDSSVLRDSNDLGLAAMMGLTLGQEGHDD